MFQNHKTMYRLIACQTTSRKVMVILSLCDLYDYGTEVNVISELTSTSEEEVIEEGIEDISEQTYATVHGMKFSSIPCEVNGMSELEMNEIMIIINYLFTSKNTTDNKEVKMVNENMDNDNETHNKDNGKASTTSGAIDTITLKDTPKEGGVSPSTPLLKNIPEDDENPDLIVDDSEGSKGSIHELSQSQNGELDKEEVKSQNQDKTFNVLDNPELDELEAKEDNTPWKLEDEMTEADKEYYDKIKNTKVSPEQHFKTAVLKLMSHMDMFFKSIAFEYLEMVKVSFGELMKTVKQLPSSKYLNQVDEELDINSPLSQYLNAYFGVQPGDDEMPRYNLHDMYTTRYEDKNKTFEEQLARRKKVALANLQEQMDKLR